MSSSLTRSVFFDATPFALTDFITSSLSLPVKTTRKVLLTFAWFAYLLINDIQFMSQFLDLLEHFSFALSALCA